MANDRKMQERSIEENENHQEGKEAAPEETELSSRRNFLRSLGKWSGAVIGGVILGNLLPPTEAEAQTRAWVNRRGGWINGVTATAGGWVNRAGGWVNGASAGWVNRAGGWVNGGGSAGWVNRAGGSGTWVNRRGY